MRRSVSWHFLLYSLAVIVVAIVAVGAVTLVLVEANFSMQEEQYLRDRGDQLLEPLQTAMQSGSDPIDLQGIASLALLAGHMRIRVVDPDGHVLADSGSYSDFFESHPEELLNSQITAFQMLLDESGNYRGVRVPGDPRVDMDHFMDPRHEMGFGNMQPFVYEIAPQPSSADVSSAAVTLPLQVDSQVVGHAELSEGPAFGQAIRDTLKQALLIGGLVALLVAAIAAVVAARQVTHPLHSLGMAADEMAHGNLQARADGSKLAEIDHLASRFNSMADQLAANFASLETERTSLRRFIADASHELRTPLTALKTFNSLLAVDLDNESGHSKELVLESGRQLDHLDQLTTDLLDLSRLEARLNGADRSVDDLRPAIEEAVSAIRHLTEEKEQTLEMNLGSDSVSVAYDPVMIERAIQNLLSNAVKFTPQAGTVQVSLVAEQAYAAIHIKDDGPGIPESEKPHIFDRFYRGRSTVGEGSGLGLAIAREIAAIHEGEISLVSDPEQGSHFILRLPLA